MQSPVVSVPGEATVLIAPSLPPSPATKARAPEERTARTPAPPPTTPVPRPAVKPARSRGAAPLVPATPEPTASAALPPPPAKRSGVPVALVLGGVGALLLVAALGAGFVIWRGQAGADTPTPEPSAAPSAVPSAAPVALLGTLRVESQPPGALIHVNGETKGAAPLEFGELPLGSYEVKADLKGYASRTQSVVLSEDQPTASLTLALTRAQPTLVAADFVSTPAGAVVTVDGTQAGSTPLVGYKLRPGAHAVEMAKDGFEHWTGTLTVQAGAPAKLEAALKAIVKATPPPTPTPEAVDTAKVYLNAPSEVDAVARKTSGPSVSYPSQAPRLRSGDSVSVTVSFVVDEEGAVGDVKVLESGGRLLDEAVVQTVQKWRYSPAVKKGIKVKARHTVKQTFRAG
jgi:TonB family protein